MDKKTSEIKTAHWGPIVIIVILALQVITAWRLTIQQAALTLEIQQLMQRHRATRQRSSDQRAR